MKYTIEIRECPTLDGFKWEWKVPDLLNNETNTPYCGMAYTEESAQYDAELSVKRHAEMQVKIDNAKKYKYVVEY